MDHLDVDGPSYFGVFMDAEGKFPSSMSLDDIKNLVKILILALDFSTASGYLCGCVDNKIIQQFVSNLNQVKCQIIRYFG